MIAVLIWRKLEQSRATRHQRSSQKERGANRSEGIKERGRIALEH